MLPSFPFFASDAISPQWVAAWFCQRQGVLCHGAVGRERVLLAPTAFHCLVPSRASCAGIFSSPAALLGAVKSSCTQLLFSWGGSSPGSGTTIPAASILLEGGVVGPCLHWIFSFGHPVIVGYIPDTRHLAQIAYTDCLKYLCLCSKAQKYLSFEKELCSRVFVKLW